MKKKNRLKKWMIVGIIATAAVGLLGIGYFFLSLPDVSDLKTKNPKTTALMEQRKSEARQAGKKLAIRQRWVDWKTIPGLLKDTVRISEDAGFYHHNGIDWQEFKEAIKKKYHTGKPLRGASTITQQLAKNLFLSTGRSYYRKVREFFIAKKLERHLSKDRIFCLYLNVIEFGPGIFGVEAASEYYFNKPVDRLSLSEILRLVAVIPKPLRVTPRSSTSGYLKWRFNFLLDKLHRYQYISDDDYRRSKQEFRD